MATEQQRWTYKVVKIRPGFLGPDPQRLQDTLNQFGRDGWELVSTSTPSQGYFSTVLYLKRPT